MAVKSKEKFEKTRHVKNYDESKKYIHVDIELQDVMKKYYQIKKSYNIT